MTRFARRSGAPPSPVPTSGREVAIRVLDRVLAEGAWAAPTLDAELRRAAVSPGEAGRATDLVYGVLRRLPALDERIDRHRPRRDAIEPFTHAGMLAATYELLHTDEKPWAILDETVGLVRRSRADGLSRFANAVLRRIAAERPAAPARPSALALPSWLAQRLERDLGAERARAFTDERPLPPPLALRVRGDRAALRARIVEGRPAASVELGALSPSALVVRGAGDPRKLPGYDEGLFTVQDEASQLVACAVAPIAGDRVLDACAGRGGKTLALLDALGPEGRVTAVDDHPEKLARMDEELRRLDLAPSRLDRRAVDFSVGLGGLETGRYDRALVDAPCTGLGTIHRRPEILLRLGPDDPARMGEIQRTIASRVARLVRPGGLFVYAVCSPTRAEGIDVVTALLRDVPSLELLRDAVGPVACDEDGVLRVGPWNDPHRGCDAFQIARFRVR
ncbi:MAG: 16S rRNA (cytosine(967)-C(5))-methyltransferase RsmB [Sandaracinaceae bacterium]